MKKKLICFLITIVMSLSMLAIFAGCTPRELTLKVLNVADYIDMGSEDGANRTPSLMKDFETWYQKTFNEKIVVQYDTVDTPEQIYQKIKNGKADYDLICPSDYMIDKMRIENLLAKYDFETLPTELENNIGNVSPYITTELTRNLSPDINNYFVGYMWGTMGILYNADLLQQKGVTNVDSFVSSWDALWGKDANKSYPALTDTIWMKKSIRDSFFCGSIYVNKNLAEPYKSCNDTSKANVDKVLAALKTQKSILKGYEVDEGKTDMVAGRATMSFQWAGDAKYAMDLAAEDGITLNYSVPNEGSNVFFDGWAMPKYAANKKLAHIFVNYLCSSEIAIRNMDYIGYTSCVNTPELLEYFSDDTVTETDVSYFFNKNADGSAKMAKLNKIYYPTIEVLRKCEVMKYFPTSATGEPDGYSPEERVKNMWDALSAFNVR